MEPGTSSGLGIARASIGAFASALMLAAAVLPASAAATTTIKPNAVEPQPVTPHAVGSAPVQRPSQTPPTTPPSTSGSGGPGPAPTPQSPQPTPTPPPSSGPTQPWGSGGPSTSPSSPTRPQAGPFGDCFGACKERWRDILAGMYNAAKKDDMIRDPEFWNSVVDMWAKLNQAIRYEKAFEEALKATLKDLAAKLAGVFSSPAVPSGSQGGGGPGEDDSSSSPPDSSQGPNQASTDCSSSNTTLEDRDAACAF
jgi:hypothetical protein